MATSPTSLLERFERLRPTPEQDAAAREWQRRQEAIRARERLNRSGIPARYRAATLDGFAPEVVGAIEEARSHGRSMVFQGPQGRGKTWAACAVALSCMARFQARFVTAPDMLSDFRQLADGADREPEVMGRYRNVRLLVLDDVGKGKPTDFALERLYAVIDHRTANGKPTIYTTQYGAKALTDRLGSCGDEETARAIVSRIATATGVAFGGEDRRLHGRA